MNAVQLSLLDHPMTFDGLTFDRERDGMRLGKQMLAVWDVMKDWQWHTLAELSARTGYDNQGALSARLRDCNKDRFKARFHIDGMESESIARGQWRYRLIPAPPQALASISRSRDVEKPVRGPRRDNGDKDAVSGGGLQTE